MTLEIYNYSQTKTNPQNVDKLNTVHAICTAVWL